MRIYIRHARKAYRNGRSKRFRHDPGLVPGAISFIEQQTQALMTEWGLPTKIFCSPYRRTRETASAMKDWIYRHHELLIPIVCEVSVSEYLGHHAHTGLDVTHETLIHQPPHPESTMDLWQRVKEHNHAYRHLDEDPEVYWFVTHGLIIKRLARIIDFSFPSRHVPYLTAMALEPKKDPIDSSIRVQGRLVLPSHLQPGLSSETTETLEDEPIQSESH